MSRIKKITDIAIGVSLAAVVVEIGPKVYRIVKECITKESVEDVAREVKEALLRSKEDIECNFSEMKESIEDILSIYEVNKCPCGKRRSSCWDKEDECIEDDDFEDDDFDDDSDDDFEDDDFEDDEFFNWEYNDKDLDDEDEQLSNLSDIKDKIHDAFITMKTHANAIVTDAYGALDDIGVVDGCAKLRDKAKDVCNAAKTKIKESDTVHKVVEDVKGFIKNGHDEDKSSEIDKMKRTVEEVNKYKENDFEDIDIVKKDNTCESGVKKDSYVDSNSFEEIFESLKSDIKTSFDKYSDATKNWVDKNVTPETKDKYKKEKDRVVHGVLNFADYLADKMSEGLDKLNAEFDSIVENDVSPISAERPKRPTSSDTARHIEIEVSEDDTEE